MDVAPLLNIGDTCPVLIAQIIKPNPNFNPTMDNT